MDPLAEVKNPRSMLRGFLPTISCAVLDRTLGRAKIGNDNRSGFSGMDQGPCP